MTTEVKVKLTRPVDVAAQCAAVLRWLDGEPRQAPANLPTRECPFMPMCKPTQQPPPRPE
jgi:hypothetical protein